MDSVLTSVTGHHKEWGGEPQLGNKPDMPPDCEESRAAWREELG